MRRIIVLLTVAAAMGAMVVLTASGAVAQPQPLEEFCDSVEGDISFGEGDIPNCTYTKSTSVDAQHGFTRTTSQVYNIRISQYPEGLPGETVGNPIVSCQNPQGKDVPVDNPNCTPVS